jgi:putative oxidoreductase
LPRSVVNVIAWLLQIGLAAVFLMAGGSKLAGQKMMVDMYDLIGYGQWFRYVTGIIEVTSAVLLLMPSTAFYAGVLIVCTMIGATIAHFTVLHQPPNAPVTLGCLALVVMFLRRPSFLMRRA